METRKLSEKGGLTIPISIRSKLGLVPGQSVDIVADGNRIIIRKHVDTCIFCGSPLRLVSFEDNHICQLCIKTLMISGARQQDFGGKDL